MKPKSDSIREVGKVEALNKCRDELVYICSPYVISGILQNTNPSAISYHFPNLFLRFEGAKIIELYACYGDPKPDAVLYAIQV